MKKTSYILALLCALCLSASLRETCAATVVEISHPESGEGFTAGTGGKLVAVQAFSTNATGTVNLSSVYKAPIFTNAVSISTVTATNYTVVSSNRLALTRMTRYDTVTNAVEISTNIFTHAVVTNILTSTVLTNVPSTVALSTNTFAAVTPESFALAYPFHTLMSFSTNVTVKATTNILPVLQRDVAKTNAIITSGSCSGNVYIGAPATNTYLKAHEWLIFSGTATGGFLRLIYE